MRLPPDFSGPLPSDHQGSGPPAWFELSYGELRALAGGYLRDLSARHTLEPTGLVHEAWLRLSAYADSSWENRGQFLATAARTMRNILIDHAARRNSLKRGDGAKHEELDRAVARCEEACIDLLVLDECLERLERVDPRRSSVVELRFFLGLTIEETAASLDRSPRTVERDWRVARAWLRTEIEAVLH